MFLDKKTIEKSLHALQGTADHMIKIWLVLKAMGLTKKDSGGVDTSNSSTQLTTLFHSGSPEGQFCVPFVSAESKYRFMKRDDSRSIIQTNVKKWMDGTVSGSDPRPFLKIKKENSGYRVSATSSYPIGLGSDEKTFAPAPNVKTCIPLLEMAVWVFAQQAIPDDESDVANYLREELRHVLNLQKKEESCVFVPGESVLSFSDNPITDAELFEICSGVTLSRASAVSGGECDRPDILAAIRAKPFILLAGMSGTGKTRIVRQLARGLCPRYRTGTKEDHPLYNDQKPGNFEIIPVRPNWHDSTELIGYVSRASGKDVYQVTDFLKFLCKAWRYEKDKTPFLLCLDEMNLAPVEQYFAEYLSIIETRKKIVPARSPPIR